MTSKGVQKNGKGAYPGKARSRVSSQKQQPEASKKKAGIRWFRLYAIMLALAVLCYANSLNNQYVFDDIHLIAANPYIKGIENLPRLLGMKGGYLSYRPLRTISYALDYTLNSKLWYHFSNNTGYEKGLIPLGYHIGNIFYHIATALIVFLVIYKLTLSHRAAFIGASLFVLHPVHTDSVTYLSGRRDILFTLFYLAGFYFFLCYRERRHYKFIVAAFAMYILSMGCKEMGVTLPALFLGYDLVNNFIWTGEKINLGFWKGVLLSLRKSFVRSYFLYPLTFLGAVAYSCYKVFIQSPSLQTTYYGDSALTTFLTVGKILVHYLQLLVLPIKLNADYTYNAFPLSSSFLEPATFFSFLLLLFIGYVTLKLLVFSKLAAFGIFWYFVTLLPVCHIFPHHELLAEHYLYLPSVGFCLIMALIADSFLGQSKYAFPVSAALIAVVVLFSLRIADRNRDWKESLTLYEKTVKTAPQCARAHCNLGEAYVGRGRIDEGIAACKRALAIKPRYAEAHYNLGVAYAKKGRLDDAIAEYREALALVPRYPQAINNLGAVLLEKGEVDESLLRFAQALGYRGVLAEARVGLGSAAIRKGWPIMAIYQFRKALALKPFLAVAHNNLSFTYFLLGDFALAVMHCDKAIKGGYPVPEQLTKSLERYRAGSVLINYLSQYQ